MPSTWTFQHRLGIGAVHNLVWGLGYRFDRDDTRGSFKVAFDPPSRSTHLWSGFVHDELSLTHRLTLAMGVKAEHNGYPGTELQPSVRVMWLPSFGQALWASVSRPVRTPARNDQDVRIAFRTLPLPGPEATPVLTRLQGESSFDSETLVAYEAGWRVQALDGLLFDLAGFYNDYSKLRATLAEIEVLETTYPSSR